ncbi:hypothetical protein B0H14DRAFT_3540801 [Mycena olivaceomarginata]|nr:hypothetical protein B0H14DRAFT_3540801 [Mycena olivaceomarginata]
MSGAPAVPPPCWPIQAGRLFSQPIATSGVLFSLLRDVSGPLQMIPIARSPWLPSLPAAVQQPLVNSTSSPTLLGPRNPLKRAAVQHPSRPSAPRFPPPLGARYGSVHSTPFFNRSVRIVCRPLGVVSPLPAHRHTALSALRPRRFPPPLRARCGSTNYTDLIHDPMHVTPRSLGSVRPLPAPHHRWPRLCAHVIALLTAHPSS